MARKPEIRVSDYFKLNKTQAQLDFVDVPVIGDVLLFVDPYSFTLEEDAWFVECNNLLVDYFSRLIESIRANRSDQASKLLGNLHEPTDTHFGFASVGNVGRGVGKQQSNSLLLALTKSKAAQTGSLNDLSDCELLIPGISSDKISDITTNIIRGQLLKYTEQQCQLHNIPTSKIPGGIFWDGDKSNWITRYANLPVVNSERLIFIPKFCTRFRPSITSSEFYNHYVLNFLQNELLHSNDSLVQTLKNGKRVIFKKDIKKRFPEDKEFLFEFSQEHPDILKKYRDDAAQNSRPVRDEDLEHSRDETREIDYVKLIAELEKIPTGAANASDYHNFIFGVLQAIFYPALHNPVKEQEINEGRKRIDISFSNGAREGFFNDLRSNYEVTCPFIFFECKNYSSDPVNPELDQLQGRFSDKRGEFGAIICRKVQDKATMLKRCKDILNANHGRIFVLDDDDIKHLLKLRSEQKRKEISAFMNGKMRELLM
jgi:hypothetical protein